MALGAVEIPCVIGRTGRSHRKREGDGKTPIGVWVLRGGFYRPDGQLRPHSGPPLKALRREDGWCDSPGSGAYNRYVRLPFGPSHESLWRDDRLYHVVFPTSHNECPRVKGLGSAIFFHLTHPAGRPTEGCVAISAGHMRKLLARCGRHVRLVVWPCQGGPPPGLRR